MYSVAFVGSCLLLLIHQHEVPESYEEVIVFVVQLGISSSFVTINVAAIILISVNHRTKIFVMLSIINAISIAFQPAYVSYFEKKVPVYMLIGVTFLSIILAIFISHKQAERAHVKDSLYT